MITVPFTLKVTQETLAGLIINGTNNNPPQFVYVHGGGVASFKECAYDLAPPILNHGFNVITFNMSGHGESTGELKKSSLEKRVTESKAVIDTYTKLPLIICGASMGGYVAIKLLEYYPVTTLILMCPALYDAKAYNVRFDQGFTEILRTQESWRNTDALKILEKFTGNILVIMGSNDEVIPRGVIDLIMEHTPKARKKELYTIANCPHKINAWLADHPQELLELQQKIETFIS